MLWTREQPTLKAPVQDGLKYHSHVIFKVLNHLQELLEKILNLRLTFEFFKSCQGKELGNLCHHESATYCGCSELRGKP